MYNSNNHSSMKSILNAGENIIGNNLKHFHLNKSSSVKSLKSQDTIFTSKIKSSIDYSNYSNNNSIEKNYTNIRSPQSYINEANIILRDRLKKKGSPLFSKSKVRNVVLNESKEIGLKNYLIGLLREKRTDINNKQVTISKALKASESKLDYDYRTFVDFVEETKKKQKKEEEEFQSIKILYEEKEKTYLKELNKNKKLYDELEKMVKTIFQLKNYGSFFHKVLGMKFELDNIIKPKENNYEIIANNIIKKYEKMDTSETDKIIEDHNYMISKFTEFEDKVIKKLEQENLINKEQKIFNDNYQDELSDLRKRYNDCYKESLSYENEKNQIISNLNKLKENENSEVKKYFDYIIELGLTTGDLNFKTKKKDNITDLLNFTKETMNILRKKEILINEYIAEIENIEINGNKTLIYEIELDRKKNNKKEKQLLLKQKREQLENLKREKAIERAQRVIIKGRMVPKIYPLLKVKKKNVNENDKNINNDFDMLFYSSDDEK